MEGFRRAGNSRTQARSPEPIFEARTLIFGVNVIHWWGIENQNFGGDPMTLPFLRFFEKARGGRVSVPNRRDMGIQRPAHMF